MCLPSVEAQEPAPTISVSQLDATSYPDMTAVVTVLDATGSPAPGLTAASFTASDGSPTPVEVVGAQRVLDTTLSLGVVLVIDTSGSMEGAPLDAAKAAATAFVRQLDPADRAALLAFSDSARVVVDFTTDREQIVAGISGLTAGGSTSLYEAVQAGVFAVRGTDAPRQAVVMLSDGENDSALSAVTEAESLESARIGRVPFFAIGFGGAADPAYLGRLAGASGGRYFEASATDVSAVYATIADQLRGQYALTLRSTAPEDGADASLVVTADVGGQRVASAPLAFVRGEAPPVVVPTAAAEPAEDAGGGSSIALVVVAAVAVAAALGAGAFFAVRRVNERRQQRDRERDAGRQSDEDMPAPLPGTPLSTAPERHARVATLTGEHAGATVQFGAVPIVLGSASDADVRIARSREVAPKHAMLWVREGKIMLRHTGGVRQTLSGGRPVDWLILEDGDEFSIGPHAYRVESLPTNGDGAS
jgi:VWFA-related protein